MSGSANRPADPGPSPAERIEGGDLTLRRFRADDLNAVYQAVSESLDHLRPWLAWADGYSRQSAADFLAKSQADWDDRTQFSYAMIDGGVLAGACGLIARIGTGGLEIGYWVHREHTRRGLATQASAALVTQAFALPGIDRVEIVHDELNVASAGVPAKLGFTEVGTRPMEPPAPRGSGIGVVWRLDRPPGGTNG